MIRLAEDREAMDRVVQQFEKAKSVQSEARGHDTSGEVSVRITPDGKLVDVVLGPRWITRLDPESYGAAVLEAYAQASLTAAEQWGRALVEEFEGPEPPARPAPSPGDSTYARLDEAISSERLGRENDSVLRAITELLRGVNRDLDGITAEAQGLAQARHTGVSRQAEVTVSGTGLLVSVEVDPAWAAGTKAASLAQHTMRAYQEALRLSSTRTVDDIIAESSLGELQRLATDPAALIAHLGRA